jgi:hypothetical protein
LSYSSEKRCYSKCPTIREDTIDAAFPKAPGAAFLLNWPTTDVKLLSIRSPSWQVRSIILFSNKFKLGHLMTPTIPIPAVADIEVMLEEMILPESKAFCIHYSALVR